MNSNFDGRGAENLVFAEFFWTHAASGARFIEMHPPLVKGKKHSFLICSLLAGKQGSREAGSRKIYPRRLFLFFPRSREDEGGILLHLLHYPPLALFASEFTAFPHANAGGALQVSSRRAVVIMESSKEAYRKFSVL